MKKRIKYALIPVLILPFVYNRLNDDFSLEGTLRPKGGVHPSSNEEEWDLLPVLRQRYTYLGKGKQAFVFLSEDGMHVLKLFKPCFPQLSCTLFGKEWKFPLKVIPFSKGILQKIYEKEIERRAEKDFVSYSNAHTFLQEQTQIEYLHLLETDHLGVRTSVYDKIGIPHTLDLDKTCFLLQRKADPLYFRLKELISERRLEEARSLIDSYVTLVFQLLRKGVDNPTVREENFGCIGSRAVLIDVGRVFMSEPNTEKIDEYMQGMRNWLSKNSPKLVPYPDEIAEKYKHLNTRAEDETCL